MSVAEVLITVEEYAEIPDDGRLTELVGGRIVELTQPTFLHGYICIEIGSILREWVKARNLGRVVSNNTGIITHRNPDSLRGADVAYYSYVRLPKETTPKRYPEVAPDIVVEVRSPSDRWRDIYIKVAEYLNAGVGVVCVLDPEPRTARLYYPDRAEVVLEQADELTFPDSLPDFRVPLARLFE